MSEIRFNYGDKFTQTSDSNTGIGSTIPAGKLDVAGGTSAGSLRVSGIATLSSYQGFVNTKLSTNTEDFIVEAGQSGSVSGEVVVSTGQTISVSTGATTGQGGIQSLKVYETFMPPVGGTADRPTDVKPGMVYYNKDFKTIEFWDGNFWKQVDNTTRRGRGVIGGGYVAPLRVDDIEFIEISTLGNALSFGDLTANTAQPGPAADSTRGLFCGGMLQSGNTNVIQYVTIASSGNGIDFGDLTRGTNSPGAVSSSTRCVTAGGSTPSASNVIDYFEIQTLGDALDFGDMTSTTAGGGGIPSPVRGVFSGGYSGDRTRIDVIKVASKGNARRFGELTKGRGGAATGGDGVRGITACGDGNGHQNTIDYINIASEGNAIDFGDTGQTHTEIMGSSCNSVRMLIAGGNSPGQQPMSDIDFITIATTGNGQDFGNLSKARRGPASLSDSHGGLGGF